jgi:two-component system sensor kinase FixL
VQVQQILVNLLRNAFEAVRGSTDPQVVVRAAYSSESVTISIEDSGPGIPQEVHERLFKAFSTSKRTGMGLGLSISRSIAQNHGGDLSVDPGGDGKGATFKLTLPRGTMPTTPHMSVGELVTFRQANHAAACNPSPDYDEGGRQ